jgi:hypothetical protein
MEYPQEMEIARLVLEYLKVLLSRFTLLPVPPSPLPSLCALSVSVVKYGCPFPFSGVPLSLVS